jgi:hypothetical protein
MEYMTPNLLRFKSGTIPSNVSKIPIRPLLLVVRYDNNCDIGKIRIRPIFGVVDGDIGHNVGVVLNCTLCGHINGKIPRFVNALKSVPGSRFSSTKTKTIHRLGQETVKFQATINGARGLAAKNHDSIKGTLGPT